MGGSGGAGTVVSLPAERGKKKEKHWECREKLVSIPNPRKRKKRGEGGKTKVNRNGPEEFRGAEKVGTETGYTELG